MMEKVTPESMKMIEEVKEAMRVHEISEYGDEKLPAGPSIHTSDAVIVVEGRSDVLNLLKYGIKNTVAVEGVSVPSSVADLTKNRTVTAFFDGDRGGELILKELIQVGEVDYVTRAPKGKEVEELEKEEVMIALRDKAPVEQFFNNIKPKAQQTKSVDKEHIMRNFLKDLEGTGNAEILDDGLNSLKEVKVENLYDELQNVNADAYTVVFDGIISQRLVDVSASKGIKNLVAYKASAIVKRPDNLRIITTS
jgi:DNA primase